MKVDNIRYGHYIIACLGLFYTLPVIYIILAGVFNYPFINGWTKVGKDGFTDIFVNEKLMESILNSVFTAVISAFLGITLSILYLLEFVPGMRNEKLWQRRALSISIFFPDILWGLGILVTLKILNVSTGFWAVLLVHTAFNSFLSYLVLRNTFLSYPSSQIKSGLLFGLTDLRIFADLILPNIRLQILGCLFLCFIYSFDDFLLTYFTSGSMFQTFPIYLYSKLKFGFSNDIVVSSALYALFNSIVFLIIVRFYKRVVFI